MKGHIIVVECYIDLRMDLVFRPFGTGWNLGFGRPDKCLRATGRNNLGLK